MPFPALPSTALDALKHDRDRFVAFAFASSDMLIELDDNCRIVYIDGATRGFLGKEAESFLNAEITELLAEDQQAQWRKILEEIHSAGRAQQRKLVLSSRLFPKLPVAVSGVRLPGNECSVFLSFSILRQEIDENEIGARDIPTGLLNREEYARRASERMRELIDSGIEARMSLVDLPDLKDFLDKLEPEKANDLRRELADYLKSKSIDNDTAGMVDEGVYSFVHDDSVSTDEVMDEVRVLLNKLDPNIHDLKAHLATLDGNLGDLNSEDTARAILFTLNQFAESGESFCFESIQDSYDHMLQDTVERITNFKTTVEDDAFELAFQPIVDLRNGIVHHYEALVRLHQPESSRFENPFHFVNFGEQTGLINEFDLAMCRRALESLDRAHQDKRWPMIAINLSGRSLSSQLFMDTMHALMEKFPHVRKQLILEVTESAKITDMERANRFLQEMRNRGNICCLDDFGVAESSFDYLRHLHVDYIKIDGSYVLENLNTTRGRHLLRAMVGMCRNLGMTTIAEMVEDEKTASILWESGMHYGQGWLFGKPETDEKVLECWNRQSPNFDGMMRTKKDDEDEKSWFDKKEG